MAPIQQALDFGADGVIIPHIMDLEHASAVTAAAKYPPLGNRSYTSARASLYARMDQATLDKKNRETACYAMIETPESLNDIEAIAALPTVDGLFPGPTDLSLTSGRGQYTFTDHDRRDLERCVAAAKAAGKPWIMPGWTPAERQFAVENNAEFVVAAGQFASIAAGLSVAIGALKTEGIWK